MHKNLRIHFANYKRPAKISSRINFLLRNYHNIYLIVLFYYNIYLIVLISSTRYASIHFVLTEILSNIAFGMWSEQFLFVTQLRNKFPRHRCFKLKDKEKKTIVELPHTAYFYSCLHFLFFLVSNSEIPKLLICFVLMPN